MATNPFKSFIPYTVKVRAFNDFPNYQSVRDPSGGERLTIGFADLPNAERLWETQAGRICAVQINEKILPATVVREEVGKRVARLADQQGHKVSKADRAAIKDQVEFDLLAKAFIKRTTIYVAFHSRNQMLVFTSSQRKADQVVQFLYEVSDGTIEPRKIETERPVGGWLTVLADSGSASVFYADNGANLIGEEGRSVSLKKIESLGKTVQDLLRDGYTVTSMRVSSESDHVKFTLTDKLIFKGYELEGVKASKFAEDFEGLAVMFIKAIKTTLIHLFNSISDEDAL